MGCHNSKKTLDQSQDDNASIVPEEEKAYQDEKEEEKKIHDETTKEKPKDKDEVKKKLAKDNSSTSRKKSRDDEVTKRQISNVSNSSAGSMEKKKSFIDRLTHFRKSKRESMKINKSISTVSNKDEIDLPSKEEAESWAVPNTGFENMMASKSGREIFSKFLKKEFSSENLYFWNACEDLKKVEDQKTFNQKVEAIFTTYLDAASPQEVSLDFKVKEKVMEQRAEPSRAMFDEAQSKIYTLMHRDSFPRFLSSSFYKELLDGNSLSSKDGQMFHGSSKEVNNVAVSIEINDASDNIEPPNLVISEKNIVSNDATKGALTPDSAKVIRELSKDSQDAFRTVTLDNEYDKLLNLIE